ncbi:unnamed protein product [Vicia faba]|uniref:AAA+ ATPase domain-containing protein n=1 Tax=Vicia faba TaxID=3906 RepID=A0AAV1A7M9_VICFA|nr:unnamed protein product [Vicia faba]
MKCIMLQPIRAELGVIMGKKVWLGSDSKSNQISQNQLMEDLMKQVIDGKDTEVTFDNLPFYLNERIKILLASAGYFHLRQHDLSNHTTNLSPLSRAILLSEPIELYHHMLAKALANCFESKLLCLDIDYFSLKMLQGKDGCSTKEPHLKRSIFEATRERVSSLFSRLPLHPSTDVIRGTKGSSKSSTNVIRATKGSSKSCDCFDEKLFLDSLYKVLVSLLETGSVILYIKNVKKIFLRSPRMCILFKKLFDKLSGPVLILGSRSDDLKDNCTEINEKLSMLFPYNIEIKPPQDKAHLKIWTEQLKKAMEKTSLEDKTTGIAEVFAKNGIDCNILDSVSGTDMMLLSKHTEEIVASTIFYHLKNTENPEYRNGILTISATSLCHVLSLFKEGENGEKNENNTEKESKKDDAGKDKPISNGTKKDSDIKAISNGTHKDNDIKVVSNGTKNNGDNATKKESDIKDTTKPNVRPDNSYEKLIRQELIPANEIKVSFSDIGALDVVKESLQEAVMLPLRRPDLFKGGGLLKPCKGVLLFGPPGTGKTMLAKAIANEAGASFINVSSSTITAKWFGQSEKNVRALFSLAAKVAPTIIFIDEVDSLLGKRTMNENSVLRRIKNEFMTHWDGLLSKPDEKIIVLAATNMPFALDEAVIRRFQRRIMVGLPSAENREVILKTLVAKDKLEDIDFKELSTMTKGYSGSDLKNLCMTAAYRPLKELMQQEKAKEMKKKKKEAETETSQVASNATEEDQVIVLRPLNMEDMRDAKNKVTSSFAEEGSNMKKLEQWNDLYGAGEGLRKKKEQLSYFF